MSIATPTSNLPVHLKQTARFIAETQLPSGAIPWFEGSITDPWDHVEAAMGLTVAGDTANAARAYRWLAEQQRYDGAWFAAYDTQGVADPTRAETNFVAYPATGLWHYYLASRDSELLAELWPMLANAGQFILDHQAPSGEVYWAVDAKKGVSRDALVTGCSSIYLSLRCLASIAEVLGKPSQDWWHAAKRVGDAVVHRPDRFDRTWPSKARYSMDWFYPVLTGVFQGEVAEARLAARWDEFVEAGLGCRCVQEEPWVTIAETCELVMACVAAGDTDAARTLYNDIARFQVEDGSWWTGYVFPDNAYWPDERPTWTAGAVLLAGDALDGYSGAAHWFKT